MDAFKIIHQEILRIAREDQSCIPGYKDALSAENLGQLIAVCRKYWADVTGKMHFEQAIKFLDTYYEIYKEEFQKYDFFYNCDADRGIAIINNRLHITLSGNVDAQVYGRSEVTVLDHAKVYATDRSWLDLHDYSCATVDGDACIIANDRSSINARENNKVDAFDASEIVAGGNTRVIGHGWRCITSYGDATVTAPINRKIYMKGTQTVTIKPAQE